MAVRPLRDRDPPELRNLRIGNDNPPFAGDRPLLATISPNGDGVRDQARSRSGSASRRRHAGGDAHEDEAGDALQSYTKWFRPGAHAMYWRPAPNLNTRTYLVRLTTDDRPATARPGRGRHAEGGRTRARPPVIRVLGVDAGFDGRATAGPARRAASRDGRPGGTVTSFRSGPEREVVHRATTRCTASRSPTAAVLDVRRYVRPAPTRSPCSIPGRAERPLLRPARRARRPGRLRPVRRPAAALGATRRVAVVLPTNTWQAYNFRDEDGDGYGDTWYAGPPNYPVRLARPYLAAACRRTSARYDLPFLHWLYWGGRGRVPRRERPRADPKRRGARRGATTSSSSEGTRST